MKHIPLHLVQVFKQGNKQEEAHLQELCEQARTSGIETTVAALFGNIEESLQNYISQKQISLLVMGIHGNRPLRNFIMGHTASHMIAEIDTPVLLYR